MSSKIAETAVGTELKAEKREKLGSLAAKKIRKSGKIPAVIHSKDGNLNIVINKKEFDVEFKKGNIQTKIIEIELGGKKIKVITNRVELDPVSDQAIHVDLLDCSGSTAIRAFPKVKFLNREKSSGIKRGGFLNIRTRKIEVICDSESQIPETIDIDIAKLIVGSKIRSEEITLPAGVKFAKKGSFLVASITGRGKAAEEETTASADAAEGSAAETESKDDEKKAEEKK